MIQTTRSFIDAYGAMVTADTILPGRIKPQRVTIRDLCTEVCARRGLTFAELMEKTHAHRISRARHEVMWLASEAGKSLPEIGRFFGFDHTSVLHGVRAHRRRIQEAA
jgi:chromosomal replication initiation ATPase DnaA